jgi:hypothetical protein
MAQIQISASQLAAACGLNPFKTQEEALSFVWVRTNPEQYAAALQRVSEKAMSAVPQAARLDEAIEAQQAALDAAISQEDGAARDAALAELTASAVASYQSAVVADLRASLEKECGALAADALAKASTPEDILRAVASSGASIPSNVALKLETQALMLRESLGVLEQSLARRVNTARGTRDEAAALDLHAKAAKVDVVDSNAQVYRLAVPLPEGHTVHLAGRVDGWHAGKKIIVEVKNRQRRLMYKIPKYERVQVEAYLRMTGADSCEFMEKFGGDSWSTLVHADDALWGTILARLAEFAANYVKLLADLPRQNGIAAKIRAGCLNVS